MKGTEFSNRTWARVGVDVLQHKDKNYMYLITVDYFSRVVEICSVSKTVNAAQTIFQTQNPDLPDSRLRILDRPFTDNGPQFDSHEFTAFCNDWHFEHLTASLNKIPPIQQRSGEGSPNYGDDLKEQ